MELIDRLGNALNAKLPGREAHQDVMSYSREQAKEVRERRSDFREGGVLVLLYPSQEDWQMVLIERPKYEGVHSGQIAFPGGAREEEDHTLQETALREANEEVGLDTSKVEVLGALSEVYIPPSNFVVRPYVAFTDSVPELMKDEREVEQILHAPVNDFLLPNAIQEEKIKLYSGVNLKVGAFKHQDHVIWGATAMMIAEFRRLLV